ncbi:NADH dehydrogenase [ubiquinone] iron-sulfur protein 6-like protein [Dinothrombium tinctorium]|uniref:NADH dehydrogenase [ubiquinone] iron-sulfur protein 6-like protein n=1 Tax=Dinothrombium tinctorium TaxID=1965070 RepID=A0A3S3SDU5_9ACAR|nr:NADH dehydrogenase [ubiquinone] iron-sulfur protein 6-like protein [Dinothrombium tinctorium]
MAVLKSNQCIRNLIRSQIKLCSFFSTKTDGKPHSETQGSLITRKKPDWEPVEKETHTGQKWDEDDYRLVRFIGKEKQINERFAIDLIAETPPIACNQRVVHCDGGDGPLGHPRVFINLDQPGNHACGYCGLRFYLDRDHHH